MDAAKRIWDFLDGKKAIIGSTAIGILGVLYAAGLLTNTQAEVVGSILTALTGIAFRLAIKKAEN